MCVLAVLVMGLLLSWQQTLSAICCCAVDGQEHNKEIYYERTIQTLEQQLLAFQQGLNGTPAEEFMMG